MCVSHSRSFSTVSAMKLPSSVINENKRRTRALQNKRYRKSPAYQRRLEARKNDVVYRWRVFKEQAKRRNISVLIGFDEYINIVRTACSYCGEFTYDGYSGVDRVQNTGAYQKDNTVACCKTCNFMKGSLSVDEFLQKVRYIARETARKSGQGSIGGHTRT